jgi:hypothetical protein
VRRVEIELTVFEDWVYILLWLQKDMKEVVIQTIEYSDILIIMLKKIIDVILIIR